MIREEEDVAELDDRGAEVLVEDGGEAAFLLNVSSQRATVRASIRAMSSSE